MKPINLANASHDAARLGTHCSCQAGNGISASGSNDAARRSTRHVSVYRFHQSSLAVPAVPRSGIHHLHAPPNSRIRASSSPGAPCGGHAVAGTTGQVPEQTSTREQCQFYRAPTTRAVDYPRTLTARAITRATVVTATVDCSAIMAFARRDSGMVSVGENATTLVKLT